MEISFVIEGKPQGKARHRLTRDGHAYTPKGTREYEHRIREEFREVTAHRYEPGVAFPAGTPVRLIVRAYFPIPRSASRRMRQAMLDGDVPCTRKPDLDNILKAVADGLNGWAYEDDVQLTRIHAARFWAELPRIEVELTEVK